MILRTLAVALFIAFVVALALVVLVASVLRPMIAWIAADERIAWGVVIAFAAIGVAVVMEGQNRR